MRAVVGPDGFLVLGGARHRAALGRGGVRADKREGDGDGGLCPITSTSSS